MIASAHGGYGKDGGELGRERSRPCGQLRIEEQDGFARRENQRASHKSQPDENQLECAGRLLNPLQIPLTDALAGHDSGGARRAVANNRNNLIDQHRNGIRGDNIGAAVHVAEDTGLNHLRNPPDRLGHKHGQGYFHIIMDIAGINPHQLAHIQVQAMLMIFQVVNDNQQLDNPGYQGGNRRAAHAQPGKAKTAINQQ